MACAVLGALVTRELKSAYCAAASPQSVTIPATEIETPATALPARAQNVFARSVMSALPWAR
jgi:hypothetical protein